MNLYKINEKILDLIDEETGEILDFGEFQNLHMEKEEKIQNVALWIKNLTAEEKAIKDEIHNFMKRITTLQNKKESLLKYLDFACEGKSRKFSNASINFRNTKAVDVNENFTDWAMKNNRNDLLRFSVPRANKKKIKEAIENGQDFEFAKIVNSNSVSVR